MDMMKCWYIYGIYSLTFSVFIQPNFVHVLFYIYIYIYLGTSGFYYCIVIFKQNMVVKKQENKWPMYGHHWHYWVKGTLKVSRERCQHLNCITTLCPEWIKKSSLSASCFTTLNRPFFLHSAPFQIHRNTERTNAQEDGLIIQNV